MQRALGLPSYSRYLHQILPILTQPRFLLLTLSLTTNTNYYFLGLDTKALVDIAVGSIQYLRYEKTGLRWPLVQTAIQR